MTINERGPANTAGLFQLSIWEIQDVTSLAEAEVKYGSIVQSAGGQIFGIERTPSVGREEEKLRIGTPDGFVQIVVSLNQPNIDAVLRERTTVILKHAGELRGASRPILGGSALPRASGKR
jgi:hypothetical protein